MKLKEVLDTATANMAASHKEVVKDLPERDARNEGFFFGVAYAADKFRALEDAEVYGLGTDKVSVVTQKLRRQAGVLTVRVLAEQTMACGMGQVEAEACIASGNASAGEALALVDAVLSVVLGDDVRVAKVVGTVSVERVGCEGLSQAFLIGGGKTLVHDLHGEVVALLEEK